VCVLHARAQVRVHTAATRTRLWHTQVMEVCLAKKGSLIVKRARFSALIQRELVSAVANLSE
jgi:hypothetical protein